jgi:Domain of unknown function (DUF4145)
MPLSPTLRELCFHCGNRVPLTRIAVHRGQELFEHIDDQRFSEDFDYVLYQCPTCAGVTIYGDFVDYPRARDASYKRIYPQGSRLLPERHKVSSVTCVPEQVLKLYETSWPLRHIAPGAFAAQVRKALEYICKDKGAVGKTLDAKLKDLATKQTFPGHFAAMTDLMRRIGNIGAHADGEDEVDFWDAELLDEFFRSVVEYIYITPSRLERMKQRLSE